MAASEAVASPSDEPMPAKSAAAAATTSVAATTNDIIVLPAQPPDGNQTYPDSTAEFRVFGKPDPVVEPPGRRVELSQPATSASRKLHAGTARVRDRYRG
ncbi:hypothetical protein MSHI_17650 [Mycobacterium shinjukuense]|uniref:Uncharacterized protein n=1 Tax=Mycobacterium shinjukuense TaxID=398694 RepID=A0A7I7MRI3_9MYCO|nr:hypothetical protein MSHI_17650 [Mycobacterium shinjukuense]